MKPVVAVVVVVVLAGCGGSRHPLRWTDVTSQLRGFEPARPTRALFTTKAKFAAYLRHEVPGAPPAIPPVDWAHEDAIVIATGPRSSTGYVLRVVRVDQTPHHVIVTVHEDTPALGQRVVARLTYPYRLITVPKTHKALFLHWPGRP